MIQREQRRLRRIFQRLLLVSLAAPGTAEACSNSSNSNGTPAPSEAGADSPSYMDAGAVDVVVPADASLDAAACPPGVPYFSDASYTVLPEAGSDAPLAACYYFVDFPCGTTLQTGTGPAACYLYLTECASVCTLDGGFVDCLYWQGKGCSDGSLTAQPGQPATIACGLCNGVGRRPAGLVRRRARRAASTLGEHFVQVAHLEAASVHAFVRLREELHAHGAPRELVRMAERSACDEIRHARVTARLARRYGGEPVAARVRRQGARSLEALARENAIEGCVRETFGAMVATWQAAYAGDKEIRKRMTRIAKDETRHAALAWTVARWADSRLGPRARKRIRRAQRAAARTLACNASMQLPASALHEAGLPSARQVRALVAAMSEVWR